MIILEPTTIAALSSAGANGLTNLLTPDPKEVALGPGVAVWTIDIDLGAIVSLDSVFLGFHNQPETTNWDISKGTGLGTGLTPLLAATPMRAADSLGPRHHSFIRFAAAHDTRYLRIRLNPLVTAPQAGILMVGKAFQAPYEFGGGRTPIDTGAKESLISGGFGIGEGVVKAQLRWTFVDLTPAQRRAMWALAKRRGEMKGIVVVEELGEDAGLGEEVHYGLFDKFQAYEREAPGQTRWSMSMTEWV